MTSLQSQMGALDAQIADLEATIGGAQSVSQAFKGELAAMQVTMTAAGQQVDGLSRSIGWGLRKAFDGLVFDGARLSDALKMLGRSMVNATLTQALKPVQNALGSALVAGVQGLVSAALPFRNGAAFSSGKVMPFARGGVVSQATGFPMRGGMGLMGEAGPEAIMPLTRGPGGKLGVQALGGGQSVHVTMNISTPDVGGFRRSQSQIAAEMARALGRGRRNS